ncbi:flagellar basal body P-ring formation chaperone FlgA [Ponticaulis profundi]|uniref:Flagellar basal body P-ring formation chaperone FlgA n=1 Tax=Ponticaulis profundi TaxID=2665222 RepID=A0ABW1S6H5_9PROT
MTLTKLIRTTALGLAVCCGALTAPALASDITIRGEWVRLGDVAPVSGQPAAKPIAASPQPGQRMPLSTAFIEAQARAAGYPVDLPEGEIWVKREAAIMPSQTADTPYQTPASYQTTTRNAMPSARDGLVPVLAETVQRGEPITPDMVSFEAPDERRRIRGLIEDPSLLYNTEATRTLRAGQFLAERDIKPVSVVRKGEQVQLVFQTGALKLTVGAKALNDAAKGEPVRVINLQSKRTMDAVAYAPGEARVG